MTLTLWAPTRSDNLDTEQDRTHCLRDLDSVNDAAAALRFVMRWRRALGGYLADPPEDTDELEALREEAGKHEAEAARLDSWMRDFAKQIDRVADDLFGDAFEDIPEAEKLAARLQKIVETANAVTDGQDPD